METQRGEQYVHIYDTNKISRFFFKNHLKRKNKTKTGQSAVRLESLGFQSHSHPGLPQPRGAQPQAPSASCPWVSAQPGLPPHTHPSPLPCGAGWQVVEGGRDG